MLVVACTWLAGYVNYCKSGVRCSELLIPHLWDELRGPWVKLMRRGLEANDVCWLEVSLFPCSRASADHTLISKPC